MENLADSNTILVEFENQLDTYQPENGKIKCVILDYGEVSVVIKIDKIPDMVFKRMSGFKNPEEAMEYAAAIKNYITLLTERGVNVLETELHIINNIVYIQQPLIDKALIGNSLMHTYSDTQFEKMILKILDCISNYIKINEKEDTEVAADSQLSNWYFEHEDADPMLIDIGNPLMRTNGEIICFPEPIYRSFPFPLSSAARMLKMVETYFHDYFDLRLAMLDILGNFFKEGAAAKLDRAIAITNNWVHDDNRLSIIEPITRENVEKYYGKDAFLLELMLKVRKFKRFYSNKIFKRNYDYILPRYIKRK